MHLQEYLDAVSMTREAFAERHADDGLTYTKVRRWCRAEGFPRPDDILLIGRVTSGKVTADDMAAFYSEKSRGEMLPASRVG